jgi:hypothetical protein
VPPHALEKDHKIQFTVEGAHKFNTRVRRPYFYNFFSRYWSIIHCNTSLRLTSAIYISKDLGQFFDGLGEYYAAKLSSLLIILVLPQSMQREL